MGVQKRSWVIVFFVVFFLIMWLGFFAKGPAAAQPKEIKVGAILPFTGTAAKSGEQIKWAVDFGIDEVNKAGGIKSMGGAKIRFIYADHAGKPEVGVSEAERLVALEKVDLLMGCYNSGITIPATEVAEKYKIPWVILNAGSDDVTERGLKWIFRANDNTSTKTKIHVDAMVDIGKKRGYPIKTMAIIYENTDWGQTVIRALKKLGPPAGIKIVLEESFPSGIPDFTPLLLKVKAANPDALCPAIYFTDAVLMTKTLAQLRWYPKAIVTAGAGFLEPKYIQEFGKGDGKYITSVSMFHSDLVKTRPWAKELNSKFKAKYGTDFFEASATAYSEFYVLIDALERAGSVDPGKLREALVKTNITEGPATLPGMERIKFGPDGQSSYPSSVVCQIMPNGEDHIVWPEHNVPSGIKWIYPDPRWKK